jgi:hypothetical protein
MSERESGLLIVPVPALVAILLKLEQDKGAPLTEAEVLHARDNVECIAMPAFARDEIAASRGYDDIDPENVWAEWQAVRPTLSGV